MKITKPSKILAAAILLPILGLIALNLFDQSLKPATQEFLVEQPVDVSLKAVEGYKYLLGFSVPADQDPQREGREKYNRAKTGNFWFTDSAAKIQEPRLAFPCQYYCSEQEFKKHEKEITEALKSSSIFLRRFDELVKFGSYGRDIPLTLYSSPSHLPLLYAAKVKTLQSNLILHRKNPRQAFEEAARIYRFMANSLKYPDFLLGVMIKLNVMKMNYDFVKDAVLKDPQNKRFLTKATEEIFKEKLDTDKLINETLKLESRFFSATIMHFSAAELLPLQSEKSTLRYKLFNLMSPLTLKRNETINLHVARLRELLSPACLHGEASCPSSSLGLKWTDLRNPVGKQMSRLMGFQLEKHIQKINAIASHLNEPLRP